MKKKYIVVDLGAESGRVMLGTVTINKIDKECVQDARGTLDLQQIHRFGNAPVEQDGALHWDFGKLFSDIKNGIAKAIKTAGGNVCGIGVDSGGVDYGLIDHNGVLIENPYHYRDSRTGGMMEKVFELMPKKRCMTALAFSSCG